jgi:hypothetical protein
MFEANPTKFAANVPGLVPTPRSGLTSAEEVFKAAKDGSKPAVLLFGDASPKTKAYTEMLGDASLDEIFGKVAYALVEFKKDGEDAKKWTVTAAPTLVLIDNSGTEPKLIKKLTAGAPPTIKKELEAAVKKLEKK